MSSNKFNFIVGKSDQNLKLEYNVLLEKAKAIYFSNQKKRPSLLIKKDNQIDFKVFDIITKHNFNNENTNFIVSGLQFSGLRNMFRYIIKFFFDNKNERFPIDLVSVYFGKYFSILRIFKN